MRVVHLNTFEDRGGAAITVQRLHAALLRAGVDSDLLVQFGSGRGARAHLPQGRFAKGLALAGDAIDPLPVWLYRKRCGDMFSANWVPSTVPARLAALRADLIHLHWMNSGMLPVRGLRRIQGPMVWTLHDMWPFTGGCHQSGDCDGYRRDCADCSLLGASGSRIASARILAAKRRAWDGADIVPVAPSEWLAARARDSALLAGRDIHVIPNGVDRTVYAPWDQGMARRILGLPSGRLVLFSAAHGLRARQKGGSTVLRLAQELARREPTAHVVLMGPTGDARDLESNVRCLGFLADEASRALAFSAVDLVVQPSEGESFGNVVLEALACGTPVVSYATGIAPTLLADGQAGELVNHGDADALCEAVLAWVGREPVDRSTVRAVTAGHDVADMAAAYLRVYTQILERVF